MKLVRLPVIGFFALLALTALAAEHYDEVYDKNGKPRPWYSAIIEAYEKLSPAEKKKREALTLEDFQKDNVLDLFPRLLTKDEESLLRRGREQRVRAIYLFTRDYFAGKDSTVHKLIPKDVLDRMTERTGDSEFRGLIKPQSLAFTYGPDIIRAPDGSWRVVEDNHGYLGGLGDLVRARETINRRMPEYKGLVQPKNDPDKFYQNLVDHIRKAAKPKNGKTVIYAIGAGDDNEDLRLKKIFSDLGVDYVSPNTKQKLTVDKNGVWAEESGKRRSRVGYIYLSGEPADVSKNLRQAMIDGRVATSYSPGTEFISDKEFYFYVENMIRHYLHEEPILKNIPTYKFLKTNGDLDVLLLDKVMTDPDKYVIKAVDGRGGDSVWVGPKISRSEFREVRKQIKANPERFIVQEYTPLSVVGGKISDIRGYTHIDSKGMVSADSYFSRVVPRNGNGKVNISNHGQEAVVMVIDPKNCAKDFSLLRLRP
jgi:uncharacterized circularly permuted ATP-grasp superfamily protein